MASCRIRGIVDVDISTFEGPLVIHNVVSVPLVSKRKVGRPAIREDGAAGTTVLLDEG